MRSILEIEAQLDGLAELGHPSRAGELLSLGEEVLEHWIRARGGKPTSGRKEGFRLLALHRQGAKGEPSFNACRETCRELVYHYNLIERAPEDAAAPRRFQMGVLLARHLALFIGGKLEEAQLGEFCCSARPLRQEVADAVGAPDNP